MTKDSRRIGGAPTLLLDGCSLSLDGLARFEAERPALKLDDAAHSRMQASVDTVSRAVAGDKAVYGVTTGFGALARKRISRDQVKVLQYNLVRSHACGVGEPLPASTVRLMMLLKANALAAGASGIRPAVVESVLTLIERGVVPRIPGRGSVGASGDLAPLAHLALALIGEGEADTDDGPVKGAAVMRAAGLEPLELDAKEGLALLNGTQLSTALAIEGWLRVRRALSASVVTGALSVEGLAGSYSPFDARIHAARGQRGQERVAEAFRVLLTESEIHQDHAGCDRVQDPYALRCMPQVLGAVWDTLEHTGVVIAREANGVSDNPLIFGDEVLSGGNFHAEPIAFAADFLAIAAAEIGAIAERRIDLLTRQVNPRLEMFLAAKPGLESGYMIAQVTAAALASENKTLAHPASVDTIPTSAGQEDHVSMAPWAGHKLLAIAANVEQILAIEALAAAVAIDAMQPQRTTPELARVHAVIRERVAAHTADRRLDRDIEAITRLITAGGFDSFVELGPAA